MRRLSIVVAAAVAAATIAMAVVALNALGADSHTAKPKEELPAKIAQCLRDHGVAVPQQAPPAVALACKQAAGGATPADDTADVTKLVACLRAHGAQPPSAAEALKPWILQHQSDPAVARALKECGVGVSPGCGDEDKQGAAPAKGAKDGAA